MPTTYVPGKGPRVQSKDGKNLVPPLVIDLCSRMNTTGCSIREMHTRLLMVGVNVPLETVRRVAVDLNFRACGDYEP
jgi:hypothetical protein